MLGVWSPWLSSGYASGATVFLGGFQCSFVYTCSLILKRSPMNGNRNDSSWPASAWWASTSRSYWTPATASPTTRSTSTWWTRSPERNPVSHLRHNVHNNVHAIQGCPKKLAHICTPYDFIKYLPTFKLFFTLGIRRKFVIILSLKFTPHLKCVATLPCEMSMS